MKPPKDLRSKFEAKVEAKKKAEEEEQERKRREEEGARIAVRWLWFSKIDLTFIIVKKL